MILHRYFPTNIGVDVNSNHHEVVSKAVDRCYELKKKVCSGGENWVSKSTNNTLTKFTYLVLTSKLANRLVIQLILYMVTMVTSTCGQIEHLSP